MKAIYKVESSKILKLDLTSIETPTEFIEPNRWDIFKNNVSGLEDGIYLVESGHPDKVTRIYELPEFKKRQMTQSAILLNHPRWEIICSL